jgi:hypothetical protein
VGFSRDGFHWDRPSRQRFIPVTGKEGDWNYGNTQSAAGCCLIVGDKLYFYFSGREKDPDNWPGRASTGLAMMRRDGFASMNAGADEGTLTTRSLRFNGQHLFVNAAAHQGNLIVEALDESGRVIEPFSKSNCVPMCEDNTLAEVKWKGAENLSVLSGQPVRFRFHLRNAALYAFWVSPKPSGASRGYVAAGGPGFSAPIDANGIDAYKVK